MAFSTADRVKETTTTTGTGPVDLDGASTGFVTFASVTTSLDDVYYVIANNVNGEFEVGEGTILHGTPDRLARVTVISSSNAGSLVNFGAGTKDVFMTAPAGKILQIDPDNALNVSAGDIALAADDITLTPASLGAVTIDGDFKLNGNITGLEVIFDQSANTFKFEDSIKLAIGTGSGTSGDAEIYQSGANTIWDQKSGFLRFYDNGVNDILWLPGSYVRLYDNTALQLGSSGTFSMDYDSANTAVIFNDTQTTKDLRFQQSGADKIIFSFDNWEFQDNVTASFGNGSDLSIEHNGTNSIIDNNTGTLFIDNSTRDIDITGKLVVNETQNLRPINMQCFFNNSNVSSTSSSLYGAYVSYTPQRTDSRFNVIYMPTGRYLENSDDPGFYARLYYRDSAGVSTLVPNEAADTMYVRGRWSDRGTGNYIYGTPTGTAVSSDATGGFLTSAYLNSSGNLEFRIRLQGVGGTGGDTLTLYGFQLIVIESVEA